MIALNNVSYNYKKSDNVIDKFSYQFNDKGFYSLIGESGSGKTTLLNIIGGILKPTSGEVVYSNDIVSPSFSISYVFQDSYLFSSSTVVENIKLIVGIDRKEILDNDILDVLTKLNIAKYKNTKVCDLSGGERQRVSIAIALLRNSKVIIADEPLSSLDYKNALEIMELLKELSKDKLVIITSHDIDLAKKYSDFIIETPFKNNNITIQSKDMVLLPNNLGKSLSFGKMVKMHRKVFGHKLSLTIISTILFSFFIALVSFAFMISNFSKTDVMKKEIEENNVENLFLINDSNEDVLKDIKNGYRLYWDNIHISNFDFKEKDYSAYYEEYPIHYEILDNEIPDNEIIVTDYILYNLRYFDVISFHDVEEMKGKTLKIKTLNNEIELKINNIEKTRAREYIDNSLEFSNEILSDKTYGVYQYIRINKKTLYLLKEMNFYIHFSSVNGITTVIREDTSLTGDDISISSKTKSDLELKLGKEINISDQIELELNTDTKTFKHKFIVKEVYDNNIPELNYSSDIITDDVKYEYSYDYETGYYYYNTKTCDLNKLLEIANNNSKIKIEFQGSTKVDLLFQDLKYFMKVALWFALAVGLISIAYMVYSIASLFKINRRYHQILHLYGMKKNNSLVFMIFDHILSIFMAFIFGTIISFILSKFFDNMISQGFQANVINTFNILYCILTCLIALVLALLIIFVYYIILAKGKRKSYISF